MLDLQRPGLLPGKKIMIAMSGGVDSSVAALLLKEAGFQPVGATLQLWVDPVAQKKASAKNKGCCSTEPRETVAAAVKAARILDIPHHIFDMKEIFHEKVVSYFIREYSEGRTPNPCIVCNRYLKFSLLLQKARTLGIDFLATGHYARIAYDPANNLYRLLRGVDPGKDQSYMLYTMDQGQLSAVLFPLGSYSKQEVREIAQRQGLNAAEKKESQEICFIPDNDYRSFLQREQVKSAPGDIISTSGKKLGRHKGLAFYTIGQRRGLGLTSRHPLYVVKIDLHNNALIVGDEEETYSRGLEAGDLSFVSGRVPPGPLDLKVKIRYRTPLVPATFHPPRHPFPGAAAANAGPGLSEESPDRAAAASHRAVILFEKKQKAVTPGQSVVFYQGDELLGGGIITNYLK